MLAFTESVTMGACPEAIWTRLVDLERWWVASNPEHILVEIESADKKVVEGTEIHFEERVAGVRAVARGRIVSMHPGVEAAWEGEAVFHYPGLRVLVNEGVKWRLAAVSRDLTIVSANVWAEFPSGLLGGVLEWHAKRLRKMEEREREHTRRELHYLKEWVERDEHPPPRRTPGRGPMAASA